MAEQLHERRQGYAGADHLARIRVPKLVWNDAGGYAGGSRHFVEAVPELTDQGLLAIWT